MMRTSPGLEPGPFHTLSLERSRLKAGTRKWIARGPQFAPGTFTASRAVATTSGGSA